MNWQSVISNKWFWITLLILVIILTIYFVGKRTGTLKEENESLEEQAEASRPAILPTNGTGIPQGWSPTASANQLYSAMKGWFTNEQMIWDTLGVLSDDQLAAVYNEFNRLYESEGHGDLFKWLEDDLSGDEFVRAMQYFDFIQFT